ncbi:MAG: ABC transporter permease, partial [Anaerolineae bacterium]
MKKRATIELPGLGGLVLSGARPILAVFLALVVSAGLIWAAGGNPIEAYAALLDGSFGSVAALANTGVRAAPLLLAGFAVGLGFKAGLWNIGGEGQIYLGAAAATAVGIIPLAVPAWLHLLLAVMAGFAGGALWILVPAYLRAYRGVNEVCTTLMLNYVAGYFVSWLLHDTPLAEPGAFYPMSPPILPSAHLPILVKGTSLHAGLILAVVLGVVLHFVLRYTPFGFRTRMVGQNPEAARYAGVGVARQIFVVMLVCGGLAGLGGAGEVLGLKLRLFDFFASGVGYEGLALAILANGNALGIIVGGVFFGSLKAGA